jgi:hypothetical protein
MEDRMTRNRFSWRSVAFAASVVAVAAAGYAFTSSVHAERSRSQDPSSWDDGRGRIDENMVPDRIAMSSGDLASGVVYIDPHKFYGELGARSDEGPVPVYDQRDGGEEVGTYDLRTGEISIDQQHSRHTGRPQSMSRTRTTVATPTTDSTVSTDPTVSTVSTDSPVSTDPTVTDSTVPTTDSSPVTIATVTTDTAGTQP